MRPQPCQSGGILKPDQNPGDTPDRFSKGDTFRQEFLCPDRTVKFREIQSGLNAVPECSVAIRLDARFDAET